LVATVTTPSNALVREPGLGLSTIFQPEAQPGRRVAVAVGVNCAGTFSCAPPIKVDSLVLSDIRWEDDAAPAGCDRKKTIIITGNARVRISVSLPALDLRY
jgi:hypothetical protein